MSPGQREAGPLAGTGSQERVAANLDLRTSVARKLPAVVDGAPAIVHFDAARARSEDIARRLVSGPRDEIDAYFAGREDGFVEGERIGFKRGYAACDDEISTLQREAHRIVTAMVNLPKRGPGSRAVPS